MGKMLKERLIITACAFAVLLVFAAVSPRPARRAVPAKPVAAEGPLKGWVICVDAGHGGADGGARARDSWVWEREINLQVAQKVQKALEALGAEVFMTRTDAGTYEKEKRADLNRRLDEAMAHQAGMLLSIHMNEFRDRKESGPQVFYREGHAPSRLLAGALQSALIEGVNPPKRRSALSGDYFILSRSIPSVLIECGFLSNSEEEAKLLDDAYQQLLAEAIARGVQDYVGLQMQQP